MTYTITKEPEGTEIKWTAITRPINHGWILEDSFAIDFKEPVTFKAGDILKIVYKGEF
jgi:hypothetical protein